MPAVKIPELIAEITARGVAYRALNDCPIADCEIESRRIQKPGLALAGFYSRVLPNRIQILGETEIEYLRTLVADKKLAAAEGYFSLAPSIVFLSKNLSLPEPVVKLATKNNVAVLSFECGSGDLIQWTEKALRKLGAPMTAVHGGLVDVFGVGVLIIGKSGIGKSEVTLDLILRGHRLVADDRVDIRRVDEGQLVGSSPLTTQFFMEVRGLGVINVRDLYGISAVRDDKTVELVVELMPWEARGESDRLGLEQQFYTILDVPIASNQVPVSAGRNLASIIEVAVRNYLLRVNGTDSAKQLVDRVQTAITKQP